MTEASVHQPRVLLNRSSPVPLYHQISSALEEQITSGDLEPRTRIENEVAMATRLGVSRPTARRALQELVDNGLLVRKRGVGTQVASALIRRPVELTSLYDDLAAAGRDPRTEILSYETVLADAQLAELLGIGEGERVVSTRRLRYADDEPLAVLTNYIRADLAPSQDELGELGLYAALRARGVQLRMARQTIGARQATAAEARMLEERPRAALLTMERTAIADADTIIEYGMHIYRASRYSFDTTLVAR